MKRLLLVFVFLVMFFSSKASHIVGGEFELLYISGNTYRINMILYFDEINGAAGAFDNPVNIRIFRKRDHVIIFNSLSLQFISRTDVGYTQLECSDGEIVTDRILYSTTVVLPSTIYNDPEGYYLAWERCCRNYGITNIFSDPPGGGQFAGQAFYLEFPPVVKNGQPFINSSPSLFPPLNDYACPYTPYYVDFAGVDDDGDSLVYSLVTPLNTWTADALPFPNPPGLARPGPYPDVVWRPGFGLNNIMNGVTNLKITPDGFLTVTPKSAGLYVFAVRCQEFRDGIKIGEVRRDFQMLVVQTGGCPDVVNPPRPSIEGKGPGQTIFGTTGTLSVSYANTVPIGDRCFEVKISDPSTLLANENFQENIKIKAIALDFKKNINEVLPAVTTDLIVNGEEAFFKICFPQACPYKPGGTFNIGIVASDDACALPLTDTLRVTVFIQTPADNLPLFSSAEEITEIIEEGDVIQTWPLQASDADGDQIQYRLVPIGFKLEDFGMSFTGPLTGQEPGSLNKTLSWDPKCDIYDFTKKTNFELYFIIEDVDACLNVHADTTRFDLSITDFSQVTPPIINNSIVNNADTIEVSLKVYGDPLVFNVTGEDVDNTPILLRGNGIGFNATAYGVEFPSDFKQGTVASQFTWELKCDSIDLELKDLFEFDFLVVDSLNKCHFYKADTLHVIVNVLPPDEESFVPPNVFSPNGDEKNDFFAMAEYDETSHEFVNILPEDNCFGEFASIKIYDRWGKQVYESFDRNFRWYGNGMPVGVYYYYIQYTNRDYKGIVSIRF